MKRAAVFFAALLICYIVSLTALCIGLEAVVMLAIILSAAFWGWVIRWLWKDGRITLSHIFGIWLVWTGTLMGAMSYYLAYRGITANLETLSRYVMVEVVAGVGGYFIKSAVENVAKRTKRKVRTKKDL